MFEKGEYVVYGSKGVCEVVDVTTMDLEGVPKDRLYYVLHPYDQKEGRIFTPVDNEKTVIRRIISKKEADTLIDEIPNIDELWISNDKLRELKYKECIRSCECREWIRIMKTLYQRGQERLASGKKITATDSRYLKQAEENLYSELSISLNIPREQMEQYIADKIEKLHA
ncbi:MAG: CarD family transcriptional regulator [Lachnospiraceae bacterium]|nr:CarD family transcriptional regulator [Lachnospiraceae bacterium]